jgi:hypothetical protein
MIALEDLVNAKLVKPPDHAVDVKDFLEHLDELSFSEREEKEIKLFFRGKPLVLNVPATVIVGLKPQLKVVLIKTEKELATGIRKFIYSRLSEHPDLEAMVPKPKLLIGFSRLDQASLKGFGIAYLPGHFEKSVRCITKEGNSTSISINLEYPGTWTIKMSKIIFDPDQVPENDEEHDFFVCLATPTLCVTLNSPTPNYGRFTK